VLLAVLRDKAKATPDSALWQEIEQTLLTNPFKHGNDAFKLLPTQVSLGETESSHWHVDLREEGGRLVLLLPLTSERIDVSSYVVPT
jgi:hypothetical protein